MKSFGVSYRDILHNFEYVTTNRISSSGFVMLDTHQDAACNVTKYEAGNPPCPTNLAPLLAISG